MTIEGVVRRATARDLACVAELWIAISDHHAAFEPLYRLRAGAEDEVRKLISSQLRDPDTAIFVWEPAAGGGGAGPAGFCTARIDRAPPILEECERAEITDLGVREGLRRRGGGRALVAAAGDWIRARGVERVEVRVASSNREGQAFWRALGFDDLVDVLHRRL